MIVWIAVGIATSSRGSADEGRVTIIFGVAPVVASFALGGPTAAIWVAAIGSLEWRELSGRVPWYGVLANHAMIMIPAGLGGIVMAGLLELGIGSDPHLGNLVAVAAGAATFCVINMALAVLTVYVRSGRRPADALGISWRAIATMMTAEIRARLGVCSDVCFARMVEPGGPGLRRRGRVVIHRPQPGPLAAAPPSTDASSEPPGA